MPRFNFSRNTGLRMALVALVLWPAVTLSAALSDAEKKTIVYRMYADYHKDFPEVQNISPKDAIALVEAGEAVFVDTREPEEIAVSTLPGAIGRDAFLDDLNRYRGKTVVAYCTISYRSGVFAQEMGRKGVPIKNLSGGILAWTLEGGKVVDPQGETTRRLHVYGKKWDFAPASYETVMFGLLKRLL